MMIAVASGKGGTGKTTVALALAECAGPGALLVDCDVEEPNCHLFVPAEVEIRTEATVPIPEFQGSQCVGCGACIKACHFHALALLGNRVLVFPELCHSCGGCVLACASGALREAQHAIGHLEFRRNETVRLLSGILNIGHAMAPPLIRKLRERIAPGSTAILDAPPGTACPMVTTVRGCDYVLLVTEPTPFGLHDLKLAVRTLREIGTPQGVILNRADDESALIEEYCVTENIPLLMRIPFSRAVAEGYARGQRLLEVMPELRGEFERLLAKIGGNR